MTCQEIQELVSPAVDKRLDPETRRLFDVHIGTCATCRNLFEIERMTKKLIQLRLKFQTTPAAVSGRVLSRLSELAGQDPELGEPRLPSWISRALPPGRFRTAFAVSLIALAALVLFVSLPFNAHHLHTSPADNDVVHQSLNNFDAVVAGTLKPEVASNNHAEVSSFFARRVNYTVNVPRMKSCILIGGLVSSYGGKPLAHVVYRHDGEVIYLYEVDVRTVLEGKTLVISSKAKEELLRNGWYIQSEHPKCSVVMWMVDSTLCTAVADIDKGELIAFLSYPDEQ